MKSRLASLNNCTLGLLEVDCNVKEILDVTNLVPDLIKRCDLIQGRSQHTAQRLAKTQTGVCSLQRPVL